MTKKFKKIIVIAVLVATIAQPITSLATIANFSNGCLYVDSNTYTSVHSGIKEIASEAYGQIKITEIFKADGSDSTYTKVYAKAGDTSGTAAIAKKGSWIDVEIPKSYRKAGVVVRIYLKGYNPALDCRVNGYWDPR